MNVLTVHENTNLFNSSIIALSLNQHADNCLEVFHYIIPHFSQLTVHGINTTGWYGKPIVIFMYVLFSRLIIPQHL